MLFAIARELGGMTVEELSQRLTVEEFVDWVCTFKAEKEAYDEARREAERKRR